MKNTEKKNVLVTGGCGFIGSHFVEHLVRKTEHNIFVVDKLSYASAGLRRLESAGLIGTPRVCVFTWDLTVPITPGLAQELGDINQIYHIAAETHVTRSIQDPVPFVMNNVASTLYLLEYARGLKNLEVFMLLSTDETVGAAPSGVAFTEEDRINPGNPYSASKCCQESICLAYKNTYNVPIIIARSMNVAGEKQDAEKYIPCIIKKILNNDVVQVHTDENGVVGSRFYIHARNVSSALLFLTKHGGLGEIYNIVGEKRVDNLELAKMIGKIMGVTPNIKLTSDHNRPGNDTHYCLDGAKLAELGWTPPITFEQNLKHIVEWTLEHPEWL